MIIAIVGAGELGGALASTLAARNRVREVRLIDEAGASAQGKALDIQQSTPVHGPTVRVTGAATLDAVDGADVVVVADAFAASREWQGEDGLALLRRLAGRAGEAPFILAGAAQAWLIDRAVAELGLPWTRLAGSAPGALAAAVRALVGLELGASPLDVHVGLTGLPPHHLVVGWESGSLGHTPLVPRLDVTARARIAERLPFLWPPGPMALGAAAAHLVESMALDLHQPRPVFVALAPDGPPGGSLARRAVIADARMTRAGIASVHLPQLSTQERLALDHALGRRS